MLDIKTIADQANVIVNGYAFTRENDRILPVGAYIGARQLTMLSGREVTLE